MEPNLKKSVEIIKEYGKTIIISAYPACGKSYCTENEQAYGLKILDSDSSTYSWTYHEDGSRERNPDFPANYIEHIKENIGKADIIFVSSHIAVRQALTDAEIPFVTAYPTIDSKAEWLGRMYLRGNDAKFLDFQNNNWESFIKGIESEPHGKFVIWLSRYSHLDVELISKIIDKLGHDNVTGVYIYKYPETRLPGVSCTIF